MKLRKVLVIYKKSTYQIQAVEHREPRFIKLIDEGHQTVTRVCLAHSEHYDVLDAVQSTLVKKGASVDMVARADLNYQISGYDLLISVGGDGTFLDASHFVDDVPILGVNSSRSSSFGHFCLANEANLTEVLDEVESDKRKPLKLFRLTVELNGKLLSELVLNEVLICHSNPAGTSRYFLEIGNNREEQRSGGIWIGPPAGSTGSMRAAGGEILSIADRQIQFIVREPGSRPYESWKLLGGTLPEDREIKVISQMRTGAIYIDGPHIIYDFALGDELMVRASGKDLLAYVNPDVNNQFR